MDLRVQLSSCVPATTFETSGAELLARDLMPLASHPKVIGLAEFMNFPGVLSSRDDVLDKLVAFQDGHIDGHAPLVRGYDLNGYLAARIRTDHETTIAEDGREKLKKGLAVLIREGSVTKDLHALAEILDEHSSSMCCLCTDDRNPLDIAEEGHLDYMVRTLIGLGRPLHHVYRAASWSAANAFGLKDRGMIAPGRRADIVLVGDLAECSVKTVISAGRVVDDALFATRRKIAPVGLDSVKVREVTRGRFPHSRRGGRTLDDRRGARPRGHRPRAQARAREGQRARRRSRQRYRQGRGHRAPRQATAISAAASSPASA